MSQLTIALTKGRILQETLPLLAAAGIEPLEDISKSRKLTFETTSPEVRLLILRGTDVPTYVEFGAADVGVSGKDTLLEHSGNSFYELLDLKIARCSLMTAALVGAPSKSGRIRIATKYVNVAKRYYAAQGRQVDIIKLYGAMELAPVLGLRANGLEPRETIAKISTRLIVNKASMKLKHYQIEALIDAVESAVGELSL
jgi:ATP phosphoribosyltransferase